MSRKNNTQSGKKITAFWAGLIAFVVVAAVLVGLTGWRTKGFKDWTYGFGLEANTPDDKTPETPDDGKGDDKNPDDSNEETTGIMLTSARIAPSDYAAYGISEDAEGATEVSVQFTPEYGKYEYCEFSCAWENPESEWRVENSGRDMYQFLYFVDEIMQPGTEINPENGYATGNCAIGVRQSVVLVLKERFSEPVILTAKVTVKDGVELTATCRIECVALPQAAIGYDTTTGTAEEIVLESIKNQAISLNFEWGDGTVKPNKSEGTFAVALDGSMVSDLQYTYNYQFKNNGAITYSADEFMQDDFTFGMDLSRLLEGEYDETKFWNDFYDCAMMHIIGSSPLDYTILNLSLDFEYYQDEVSLGTFCATNEIRVTSFEDLPTWVTSIELSKDIIVLY